MKYLFIAPIYNLEISEYLGRGAHVVEDFFVSNDPVLAKELLTERFIGSVGTLESEHLLKSPAFAFSSGDWPFPKDSEHSLLVLGNYLRILQMLFMALWVVKDNSANTELGFIEVDCRAPLSVISSNARAIMLTNCRGETGACQVSRSEFETARGYLGRLEGEQLNPFSLEEDEVLGRRSAVDRISRAWYFLQAARASTSIPERITYYCVCLETLVSTDTAGLSHKVAERVAWLVGKSKDDRMELYRILKRAYSLRSQTVHGSSASFTGRELPELSEKCDDILRRIYEAIFRGAEVSSVLLGSNQDIDEYFLERVLAG